MTIQTQLEAAVAQASVDSDLLHQIVHGGSTSTVTTEGGPVRTLAKLIADKDAEINQATDGLLEQSTALAASAALSEAAAASSEAAAQGSAQQALASETAAHASMEAAALSELAAADSATNAASSEALALAHKNAAAASQSAAAGSEAHALSYMTAAQVSQAAAASSENHAAASAISAATSAASAAAALDNFDDRYLGPKSEDPYLDNDGNALLSGALYFNTTDGVMKIYTASGWIAASSATVATLQTFEFVAAAGQTDFSGLDTNELLLSYLVGAVLVTLNGVRLRPGEDYTATTGNSIVLLAAASAGDELVVDAFGNFLVADTYSRMESDARFVNTAGGTLTGRTIVSVASGKQLTLAQWGDVSAADGGQMMIAGNAHFDKATGEARYSNAHASIGAVGIRFNSPSWNSGALFTSGTTSSVADVVFTPVDALKWDSNGRITMPSQPHWFGRFGSIGLNNDAVFNLDSSNGSGWVTSNTGAGGGTKIYPPANGWYAVQWSALNQGTSGGTHNHLFLCKNGVSAYWATAAVVDFAMATSAPLLMYLTTSDCLTLRCTNGNNHADQAFNKFVMHLVK